MIYARFQSVALIFLLFICLQNNATGQILTFDFAGLAGDEASDNSNYNDANLASSTITRGAGLTASANADRYNATSWALTSIANAVTGNDYMEFTIDPDAGYQFTVSSIIISLQRSSTGPSAIAIRNSLDGYTANLDGSKNITDNINTQTFTFTFAQSASTAPVTYRIYMYAEATGGSGGPGDYTGNDIIVNGTVSSSTNTITTGTVSSPPFAVTCTATAAGTVAFTSTGTFSGNTYTAQLSDGAGSFASPINIGTLVSNANSGTINITIPVNMPGDNGYRIRVISSNPAVIGSISASFRINMSGAPCSYFEIESILVNSCGASTEGENEMFRFEVGALALNTSAISITWPNNPWLGICQNATTNNIVNQINNDITGGGQVLQPTGGVIPAGATVMFFTSTAFDYGLFDFSALNYTIYAVFQCPGNTNGHFANTDTPPCEGRTLTVTFSGYSTDEVTYDPCVLDDVDGEAVDFDVPGNPTYGNTGGCFAPFFPLPVEILSFDIICEDDFPKLEWSTATETNCDHFIILRSSGGNDFDVIATVKGAGNSNEILQYEYHDRSAPEGILYYRLTQTDFDGQSEVVGTLASACSTDENEFQIILISTENGNISLTFNTTESADVKCCLYDMTGALLHCECQSGEAGLRTISFNSEMPQGIYFITLTNGREIISSKFLIF
jgi:hypothetical protein